MKYRFYFISDYSKLAESFVIGKWFSGFHVYMTNSYRNHVSKNDATNKIHIDILYSIIIDIIVV